MFPIKAKEDVPVSQIVLNGVAVRGQLVPLTVWVSNAEESDHANNNATATREYRFPLRARHWQKVYEATHAPSRRTYQWLHFSKTTPVILRPGQVRALYIHSTAVGDESIVYDNANVRPWQYGARRAAAGGSEPRYQDAYIQLLSGKAHLSPRPFGQTPIWGWGNAWRDHREFVGQVSYGVRFQLWQPVLTVSTYGPAFRTAVQTLLACQRRVESNVALLPDECLYYILNMCKWDWFDDTTTALKEQRRRQRRVARQQQQQLTAAAATATNAVAASAEDTSSMVRQVTQESSTHAMEESQHNDNHEDEDDDDDDVELHIEQDEEMSGNEDDDEEEEENDDEEAEEVSDSDESAWERQHGYRADANVFMYRDVSSGDDDSEEEEDPQAGAVERQAWFRRHFARIHVLRALAQAEQEDDVVMHVDGRDDSSSDDEDDDDDYEVAADYEVLQDSEEED